MNYRGQLYQPDIATLKDYNGKKFKLTVHKFMRSAGFEDDSKVKAEKGTVNDEKLQQNISRARSKLFEYALCNEWDLFGTFTIDGKKYNRNDLETYHKDLGQFIRNYNKKYGTNIKYLLVPEEHQKGGWHEHGLLIGLPIEHLRLFTLKEKLPKYIRDKLKAGEPVYEWKPYREKFGFCDMEPVRNKEAVSKYVTKYITKDLTASIKALNAHLYYCSQGLNTATEIKRGTMLVDIVPDYENEYVKVKWFDGTVALDTLKKIVD